MNGQDDKNPGTGEGLMGDSTAPGTSGPEVMERLLRTGEVAVMFRVDPKTVRRWASTGKLTSILTPGGRDRRYREAEVRELIDGSDTGRGEG